MRERVPDIVSILRRVCETFKDIKASMKNSDMLRNSLSCMPVLANEVRCQGNHDCLLQRARARDDLVAAREDPRSNFCMITSIVLNSNARKHQKMPEEILVAAKEMETSFHTISSC